jgi:hypothetical protein
VNKRKINLKRKFQKWPVNQEDSTFSMERKDRISRFGKDEFCWD